MTKRLALSTRNEKKRVEMERLLGGVDVEILTPNDVPGWPEVEETGDSFVANAILKAVAGADVLGSWCIADDSGIEVDALDGRPGIYSARFSGAGATDESNNEKLLTLLDGVPLERRTGQYQCAIAIAGPLAPGAPEDSRYVWTVQESCDGRVAFEPKGTGGFGYDPLFEVTEADWRRFSEMTPEEKDRLSHRGKALRRALPVLISQLEGGSNP